MWQVPTEPVVLFLGLGDINAGVCPLLHVDHAAGCYKA